MQEPELLCSPRCTACHVGCLITRRVKMLMVSARPHNQKDADRAGGLGEPDNGRRLRSAQQAGFMDT